MELTSISTSKLRKMARYYSKMIESAHGISKAYKLNAGNLLVAIEAELERRDV